MGSERVFNIGDQVRIREWDDMEMQFGTIGKLGSIHCSGTFTRHMRALCGTQFVITSMRKRHDDTWQVNEGDPIFRRDKNIDGCWIITTDMIEPDDDSSDEDQDSDLQRASYFELLTTM